MMPIHSSPTIASTAFTVGSLFIVVGLLVWWVLGGVCSPVTLGLHSDWTTAGRWLGGAATIALCFIVAYACARITERNSTVELLGKAETAPSDRRIPA